MPAVKKWGNSLALRIPSHMAQQLHITENSQVECSILDGNLIVKPVVVEKKFALDQLLQGITEQNRHDEINMELRVGKEVW
jgi:antitoxin MazE